MPEPSLNLTPTLYLEPRFPMFITNGYDRKANAYSPWNSCFVSNQLRDRELRVGKIKLFSSIRCIKRIKILDF